MHDITKVEFFMSHILQSMMVVIPIIFVLAFGFFAGKVKAFGDEGNPIRTINELVLNFALPPTLFLGTISVSRTQLMDESVLFFTLLVTLFIAFWIGLFIVKYFFKRNIIEAAIAGLAVSFSAGPFYGPALLDSIYKDRAGVAISMISLVINVFIVPLATTIIKLELDKQNSTTNGSVSKLIGSSLYQAIIKTPFVWAPLLGFILVFIGIPVPEVIKKSLGLIGQATAGIAVFVAGMTIAVNKFKITWEVILLAVLKNIGLPLLFIGVAVFFHITKSTNIFNEGLLLAALPSGPMIILLATRYKQYQQEASSILAISTIGMLITVTALIVVLNPT